MLYKPAEKLRSTSGGLKRRQPESKNAPAQIKNMHFTFIASFARLSLAAVAFTKCILADAVSAGAC